MALDDLPCVLSFRRSRLEVEVAPNQLLLEAAEAAGISLGSLCRGGSCGTCKVRLLAGQPRIETSKALNPMEKAAGWILTCSSRTVAGQRIVLDI